MCGITGPMTDGPCSCWGRIQALLSVIGGGIGFFLGGMDGVLTALMTFMVLDYLTGVMCAIVDKKLSSTVGFRGICRKVLILVMVGMAHMVDQYMIGNGSALRGIVIYFYLSNEGLSLMENAAYLGLPIPEKLKEALAQLHRRKPGDKNEK